MFTTDTLAGNDSKFSFSKCSTFTNTSIYIQYYKKYT